ncbi:MAG: adenylate/guanylate cyclase domain-containing protein [Pseudomonadota bacterium]
MPFGHHAIDPAPRTYPSSVALLKRSARRPDDDASTSTMMDVQSWLLTKALAIDDLLTLFEEFNWRLVATGLKLDRATLHIGTLHPQLAGFSWNWEREDGLCDEIHVPTAALEADAYLKSPLYRVLEYGEAVCIETGQEAIRAQYPLMAELNAQGYAYYLAKPLYAGATLNNAVTIATRSPHGFDQATLEAMEPAFAAFSLHVARHTSLRVSANIANAYLGEAAGRQVLEGSIKRGHGAAADAVIWMSDLRGFTDLADRLSAEQMALVLNSYFDVMASAVLEHGGEVLKFIGDGLLCVFPLAAFGSDRAAARAAEQAAQTALIRLETLNGDVSALPHIDNWRPLATGIALHSGTVFFGNVGAPNRLDFTVIGKAVNAAARVEALSKSLGRPLLVTQSVAQHLDRPLVSMGTHALRGVAEPMEIFAPA